jgi:hypothetical protein
LAPLPDDPFAPGGDGDRPSTATRPATDPLAGYPEAHPRRPDFDFDRGTPPPFRLDSVSVARIPLPAEREAPPIPDAIRRPAYPQDRVWLHLALFLATVATTTYVGATQHYLGFLLDFKRLEGPLPVKATALLLGGLSYSVTVLGILGAHEFGHYFACRYYHVNASLPYFLPVPTFLAGTLGAFIRIRQPIWSKRALFDIGVAGPFAGFAVAVPALVVGLALSHVAPLPKDFSGYELGEPLLFKAVSCLIWGTVKNGYSLNLHPVAFGAWFGMFATALNLIPFGQLDGGHVSYAVFGKWSTRISFATLATVVLLAIKTPMSWTVWAAVMAIMVVVFGASHPATIDEHEPLDRTRLFLAAVALAVFVLSFTPAPIDLLLMHK